MIVRPTVSEKCRTHLRPNRALSRASGPTKRVVQPPAHPVREYRLYLMSNRGDDMLKSRNLALALGLASFYLPVVAAPAEATTTRVSVSSAESQANYHSASSSLGG